MRKYYLFFVSVFLVGFLNAQFTPGNLVVVRLGDGATYNWGAAARCFLDEYTTAGTFVQTIAMPVTSSGSNRRFMLSKSIFSGKLTLSADGRYLFVPGYDVSEFSQPLTSFTSAVAPRIIARIDKNGSINTTTVTGAYSGETIEAAYSTNGTDIWVCGSNNNNNGTGGFRYLTFGATSSTLVNSGSLYSTYSMIGNYNNQLYASTNYQNVSLVTVGTGYPTTTASVTNLPGMPTSNNYFPVGFFMADLDAGVAGPDVLYFLDGDNFGGPTTNTLSKYSLVGGTWVKKNAVTIMNPRGMTGVVNGNNITLYVTTDAGISVITDGNGYNTNMTAAFTSIATVPTNTAFLGIAFAPTDVTTSVQETANTKMKKVYQRSSTELQVDFTSTKPAAVTITITDVSGKQISNFNYRATTGVNSTVLNISGLQKAVYLVTIINGKEKTVSKFIKQ